MRKLEHLEKYVQAPSTQFYGVYFFDGEDVELHNETEEFENDKGEVEEKLTIIDKVENGIFYKEKTFENLVKGSKETTNIERPLEDKEMLVFVQYEGFVKTSTPLISIDKAIELYKIIK